MSIFEKTKTLPTPPFHKRFNGVIGSPALIAGAVAFALVLGGGGNAFAKGGLGTATPPAGAVAPFVTPTLPDPVFANPNAIHQFDVIGFIQTMTLDTTNAGCPNTTNPGRYGGTVKVNRVTYTVPCNTVIQMPANTLTWAQFV
ncbi:MAG: hypothetical protein NTV76_04600, partial [Pseudomonas sp.]|nr:hypothetical protein [Pseudomonas sp.]